jgi:hypothetical protein
MRSSRSLFVNSATFLLAVSLLSCGRYGFSKARYHQDSDVFTEDHERSTDGPSQDNGQNDLDRNDSASNDGMGPADDQARDDTNQVTADFDDIEHDDAARDDAARDDAARDDTGPGGIIVDSGFPRGEGWGGQNAPLTVSPFTIPGSNRLVCLFLSFGTNLENLSMLAVSGGGLSWTRAGRINSPVDAVLVDLWYAWDAVGGTHTGTIISAGSDLLYGAAIVVSFAGAAATPGTLITANGSGTVPTVPSITTTGNPSLLYAAGVDWNLGAARTMDATSTKVYEYIVGTVNGDTHWLEYRTTPPLPGTYSIGTTAPVAPMDWAMLAVEIKAP